MNCAWTARRAATGERMSGLVIRDANLLDCAGAGLQDDVDVEVRDGIISKIRPAGLPSPLPAVDGTGTTLMPGLTDAHVHMALVSPGGGHGDDSYITQVLMVKEVIERTLMEGFTTVRDAGGLEPEYARAAAAGKITGPRILPSGSVLSQTGGHGDLRAHHQAVHGAKDIPGLISPPQVVDGVTEVRKAAREQLRRGATQIKVFASGGVLSPTDPFDSLQFAPDELRAAVEVARSWHTYVLAHCHTSESMQNALDAGVRSIEHATVLDEPTARRIREEGAFAVVTLLVLAELLDDPAGAGLSDAQLGKLRTVEREVGDSIRRMREARLKMGSGSDIVGPVQSRRAREIVLKAEHIGPLQAILTATRTNAELFGLADRIGTVEEGKEADLILVAGDPLQNIGSLAQPERVTTVIKGGTVVKDLENRAAAPG